MASLRVILAPAMESGGTKAQPRKSSRPKRTYRFILLSSLVSIDTTFAWKSVANATDDTFQEAEGPQKPERAPFIFSGKSFMLERR